jgi:hypothetical protein
MLAPTDIDFDKLGKIYTMKFNVFQKLNEFYNITVLVKNMGDTDQTTAISLGNSHFEDYFLMTTCRIFLIATVSSSQHGSWKNVGHEHDCYQYISVS